METKIVKNVLEPSGDRMADVIENAILLEATKTVLVYAQDIADNDPTDIEAQNCVKVLKALKDNAASAIGDSIA